MRGNINIPKLGAVLTAFFGSWYLLHISWLKYSEEKEKKLLEIAKKEVYEKYPELRPYVNLDKDDFAEYKEKYAQKLERKD